MPLFFSDSNSTVVVVKSPNMSQNNQIKPEFLSDPAPLSPDEQSYLRTLLSEEDLEKCYEGHCEAAHRKLWNYFQVLSLGLRRQKDNSFY